MYQEIKNQIKFFGFSIVSSDFARPWGGFLVIDETQAQEFSNKFFEGLDVNTLKTVSYNKFIFEKTTDCSQIFDF